MDTQEEVARSTVPVTGRDSYDVYEHTWEGWMHSVSLTNGWPHATHNAADNWTGGPVYNNLLHGPNNGTSNEIVSSNGTATMDYASDHAPYVPRYPWVGLASANTAATNFTPGMLSVSQPQDMIPRTSPVSNLTSYVSEGAPQSALAMNVARPNQAGTNMWGVWPDNSCYTPHALQMASDNVGLFTGGEVPSTFAGHFVHHIDPSLHNNPSGPMSMGVNRSVKDPVYRAKGTPPARHLVSEIETDRYIKIFLHTAMSWDLADELITETTLAIINEHTMDSVAPFTQRETLRRQSFQHSRLTTGFGDGLNPRMPTVDTAQRSEFLRDIRSWWVTRNQGQALLDAIYRSRSHHYRVDQTWAQSVGPQVSDADSLSVRRKLFLSPDTFAFLDQSMIYDMDL